MFASIVVARFTRVPDCTITPSAPLNVMVFERIWLLAVAAPVALKTRMPAPALYAMVLPAPAAVPPIVLFAAPPSMAMPWPLLEVILPPSGGRAGRRRCRSGSLARGPAACPRR